jgi:hypothetical protein
MTEPTFVIPKAIPRDDLLLAHDLVSQALRSTEPPGKALEALKRSLSDHRSGREAGE